MKVLLTIVSLILATSALAAEKIITVAVIDTGIDPSLYKSNMLCKYGHRDFTGTNIADIHGHGTHVSGLIDQYAKDIIINRATADRDVTRLADKKIKYCQVIIKYYSDSATGPENQARLLESLKWALALHVDIINYSGGGEGFDYKERKVVMDILKSGIKLVVAAGNDGHNLGEREWDYKLNLFAEQTYYPAMYDKRIISVGNLQAKGQRAPSSNYGNLVSTWEIGTSVLSLLPKKGNSNLGFLTGTSQAAAIHTGKLVHSMLTH